MRENLAGGKSARRDFAATSNKRKRVIIECVCDCRILTRGCVLNKRINYNKRVCVSLTASDDGSREPSHYEGCITFDSGGSRR